MSMLNTFPDVSLRSISFISSIVLLFLDNYVWYRFFSLTFYHSTNEMMGFLLICVWFVPSGFILSISLSDEVLPGISNSFGANSSDEQFRGSAENPKFTILQKLSVKSLLELLKWRSRKPLLPDSNLNQQFAPESNLQAQYPPQFGGAPFRHPSMGMPAPTIGHRRGYHPEKYN